MIYPPTNESKWFAVFTKFKCEKAVKKSLAAKGIEVYLPLRTYERKYGAAKKRVELPLISCYVFVKIAKRDYVPVLQTENVVKFIKFANQLIPITENEMDVLKMVVKDYDHKISAEPYHYQPGDQVEIAKGSLKGLKGKLVSNKGKDSFLVEMKKFAFNLKIEISKELLKPIGPKTNHLYIEHNSNKEQNF